jgi:phage N-6-adenine-methyltransferase
MNGSNAMFTSVSEDWSTPQWLFDQLNAEFNFTIDVCASEYNAKVQRFFTKEQDGLKQDWSGETVWCNPPYGRQIKRWIYKAYKHFIGGALRSCYFLQEQILHGSTIMLLIKQRLGLFVEGLSLKGQSTMLHFHQWLLFTERGNEE